MPYRVENTPRMKFCAQNGLIFMDSHVSKQSHLKSTLTIGFQNHYNETRIFQIHLNFSSSTSGYSPDFTYMWQRKDDIVTPCLQQMPLRKRMAIIRTDSNFWTCAIVRDEPPNEGSIYSGINHYICYNGSLRLW